jgi:energy-coupling factor transporter transmembrane protein EcfT
MNQSNIYKLLSIFLVITVSFLYIHQARAAVIIAIIAAVVQTTAVVVAAVGAIGLGVAVVVAQVGLALAPAIFTTLWGTAIVGAVFVGVNFWAADCLFDGSAVDPDIICTGKEEGSGVGGGVQGGAGGGALQVDVKVNGSDGPLTFRAPATFKIQWAIAGADSSTSCSATGDWSGTVSNATGETTLSEVVKGSYNYGIRCVKGSEEASDNVIVNVNNLPVCSFSASPKQIVKPGKSLLSWECQYADSCQISNGATTTVSNTGGTLEVRPDKTTTYILTCNNLDGPINLTAEVRVLTPGLHEIPPGGE